MTPGFDLRRRLACEALGSAFLVCAVVGSGIMAETLTRDMGLALLANTLATAAILVVLVSLFAPISGAHFNPAISLVTALSKQIGWREFGLYVGAQLAGGVAGTMAAHMMFDLPLLQISTKVRTGEAQWASEFIAAFGLALVILLGKHTARNSIPWLVGLYIAAAYWFTASTSFANPAVALARTLTDSFSGIRPVDLPPFVLMELAGAALAVFVVTWVLRASTASET